MKKDHNRKRKDCLGKRLHNTAENRSISRYIKNIYKSTKRQTPEGKTDKAYKQTLHQREDLNSEFILWHGH